MLAILLQIPLSSVNQHVVKHRACLRNIFAHAWARQVVSTVQERMCALVPFATEAVQSESHSGFRRVHYEVSLPAPRDDHRDHEYDIVDMHCIILWLIDGTRAGRCRVAAHSLKDEMKENVDLHIGIASRLLARSGQGGGSCCSRSARH